MKHVYTSSLPLNTGTLNEKSLPQVSNVAFTFFLKMHIDEEPVQQEGGIITNQRFIRSFPQPITCEKSVPDSNARNGYQSSRHSQHQKKYYSSYWSKEAVTAALEVCVLCIWSFGVVKLLLWCLCKSLNCIPIRKISHPVTFSFYRKVMFLGH